MNKLAIFDIIGGLECPKLALVDSDLNSGLPPEYDAWLTHSKH